MRTAMKILIPLVLIIALLVAACWYFLIYNRTFTVDFLVENARSMASQSRFDRAITYYDLARKLSPDSDVIPLELSETYVASGNYTKAEYTLVSAIAENPGHFELYAALSRTYLAQDKLLDAVQMLDRVTDGTVKAALDQHRPAAPVVTPESGYYTEYIEVSVQSPEQRIYVTTDGNYPSNASDLYTEAIQLQSGENTIIALAANELGLVSPAVVCGYTIGGVVEEITLADPAVDAAVREQLGMTASDTIMTDDLWGISTLQIADTVSDLQDLVHFTGLRSLTIQGVSGLDFSVLRELTTLQELDLSGCTISSNSLDAIGSLSELHRLVLNGCALTDLTALSPLTKLTDLQLADNSLTDVGVLSLMLDLETVTLTNNPISSIGGLTTCSKLQVLDITGCGINSIGSLSGKTELRQLWAANNRIEDLSPLAACGKLETLIVSSNLISDISVLKDLPALMIFEANTNQIAEIPDFDEKHSVLIRFSADYNVIEDISGLGGINSLNYVDLDYNQVKDIQPLVNNYNLIQVDVWDNPIPDIEEAVKPFEESSVIVNFNPNFEVPEEAEEGEEET